MEQSGGDRDLRNDIMVKKISETFCYDGDGEDHLRGDILCPHTSFMTTQAREFETNSEIKSRNRNDGPSSFRYSSIMRPGKRA